MMIASTRRDLQVSSLWRAVGRALLTVTLLVANVASEAIDKIAWEYAKKNEFPYAAVVFPSRKPENNFIAPLITPSWLLIVTTTKIELPADSDVESWGFVAVMGIIEFADKGRYPREGSQERRLVEARNKEDEGAHHYHRISVVKVDHPFDIEKGKVEPIAVLGNTIWPSKYKVTCRALAWLRDVKGYGGFHLRKMELHPLSIQNCSIPPQHGFALCVVDFDQQKLCSADPKTALIECQNAATAYYARFFTSDADCEMSRNDLHPMGRLLLTLGSLSTWIYSNLCPDAVHHAFFIMPPEPSRASPPAPGSPSAPSLLIALAFALALTLAPPA